MTRLDAAIALARLAEAGGAAVLFGAPLLLVLAAEPKRPASAIPGAFAPTADDDVSRAPRLVRAAAGALGAGSVAALVLQTAGMAGSLREALAPATLAGVVADTGFGRSVVVRAAAAAAAVAFAGRARRAGRTGGRVALTAVGGAALASLAWSGHGAADVDGGALGLAHLGGDLVHLLAAGAWVGALAALLVIASEAGHAEAGPAGLARALLAFSGVGVAVVGALLASGLANLWFLAGPAGWSALLSDAWGRVLVLKLAGVAAMLALAALHRWRWTPALARAAEGGGAASLPALRGSLAAEAALGLLVLAAAAVMGGLAPPAARA